MIVTERKLVMANAQDINMTQWKTVSKERLRAAQREHGLELSLDEQDRIAADLAETLMRYADDYIYSTVLTCYVGCGPYQCSDQIPTPPEVTGSHRNRRAA